MNYIESAVELASLGSYTLTQNDFDISINALRDRPSTDMPHVSLTGSNLSVGGIIIDDPERDTDVTPIIWEVRRERRSEIAYEGHRFNDIRRWGKLEYADMTLNPKLNLGAWVDKPRYVTWYNQQNPSDPITIEDLDGVRLDRPGNEGYIKPITNETLMRTYSPKDYLYPIPSDQISLYQTKGITLTQNPGWN